MTSYRLVLSTQAQDDLERLLMFLVDKDLAAAQRARQAIEKGYEFLEHFPFSCRKASDSSFLRELIISFGHSGYVALFEIDNADTVTVLAVRHQREDDYH